MLKKLVLVAIIVAFVGCAAGCSSSAKFDEICDTIYNKIDSACDLTDPTEAGIVAFGLSGFYEETITAGDVMAASKDDFTSDCKIGYEENMDGVDGALVDAFVDAQLTTVNALTTTDCTTMMTQLGLALI